MRILCLSAPLPGHLDWGGYLATAAELARRGHDVCWASGREVAPTVTRAGIAFRELATTGWRWPPPPPLRPNPGMDAGAFQRQRKLRALDQWLDPDRVAAAVRELQALVADYRPDVLASEMFIAATGIVAEMADTPFAVAGWPAPPNAPRKSSADDPLITLARARLERLLETFGVQGVNWTAAGPPALRSPGLHLSYWSPAWFGHPDERPPTRHVGGVAPSPVQRLAVPPPPDGAPWIFITLGTSFNDDPAFFTAATQAVEELGGTPIIAAGPGAALQAELRRRLPSTAHLFETVDFRATLPYVSAAIHHGGAGVTHALVTHGVPQVVTPHAADQSRQAQGVARTGVGYHMAPRQATAANLTNALAQLLPDRSPQRAAARRLQSEFAALGGIPRAAELIEQLKAL